MKEKKEERIAKLIAAAGVCSRRDAEKLIAEGKVSYKGSIISNPATKFISTEGILVNGRKLNAKEETRLWLYHKPVGLVVSHRDEQGRDTIFDHLPLKNRVISVGRLDKNTSGLIILTNDGALARELELPKNKFERTYLVKVFGKLDFKTMQQKLAKGIRIEDVIYGPVKIEREKSSNLNHWLYITLSEGKNREIRNILAHFNLLVSKLTRVKYGPFVLGTLAANRLIEIPNWQEVIDF